MKRIYTRLLITNDGPPLREVTVSVDRNGRVLELTSGRNDPSLEVEVLVPGFVNAHCHLELSNLFGKINSRENGMAGFIRQLIALRFADEDSVRLEAMQMADEMMVKEGIVAVGDISNYIHSAPVKAASEIYYHTFVELPGLQPERAAEITAKGIDILMEFTGAYDLPASLSPHAPYSVSLALYQELFARVNYFDPLTIHVQESEEEIEFCMKHTGALAELFTASGFDFSKLEPFSPDRPLKKLLPLFPQANRMQLVHNTVTTREEIHAAESLHPQLFWCVCPSANEFITGGVPPLEALYKEKVRVTIGTDSLASNTGLSVLSELKKIAKHCPEIPFETLMLWSSWNGAVFLGLDHLCGKIKPGIKPGLLSLSGMNADHPVLHEAVQVQRIC